MVYAIAQSLTRTVPVMIFLLSVLLFGAVSCFPPQFHQNPAQNWESVILSRNGPSTSTTPRPTRWTTTTLRSFGIAPLTGTGKATFQETKIATRRNNKKPYRLVTANEASAAASEQQHHHYSGALWSALVVKLWCNYFLK